MWNFIYSLISRVDLQSTITFNTFHVLGFKAEKLVSIKMCIYEGFIFAAKNNLGKLSQKSNTFLFCKQG